MANQIADNFGYLETVAAAERTADHMRRFWSPIMIERAQVLLNNKADVYNDAAGQALNLLLD
jgi:hypothetical protein